MKMTVTEPAELEYAAQIVFAPKKDGSIKFFADYLK